MTPVNQQPLAVLIFCIFKPWRQFKI